MVMFAVTATLHWLFAATQSVPNDPLSQQVLARVANPLLTSAQFLIPAAVAISGIHKMMEHRESALTLGALIDRGQHGYRAEWVGLTNDLGIEQKLLQQTEWRGDVEPVDPRADVHDGASADRGRVEQRRDQELP